MVNCSDTIAVFRMFLLFVHLLMKIEVAHCAKFLLCFAVPFEIQPF